MSNYKKWHYKRLLGKGNKICLCQVIIIVFFVFPVYGQNCPDVFSPDDKQTSTQQEQEQIQSQEFTKTDNHNTYHNASQSEHSINPLTTETSIYKKGNYIVIEYYVDLFNTWNSAIKQKKGKTQRLILKQ